MTTTAPTAIEELDSSRDVLVFARSCRVEADRAEANLLAAAAVWAEQHPPESIDLAATWVVGGGDTGLALAGAGAPLVAEFCLAEFAAAIGRTTDSGRRLVADALELKYRLPRTWARIHTGHLPVWRARRISEATLGLSAEAAGFVDAQVAAFADKVGLAQLDRLVAEATLRFTPDQALRDADAAADGRHVTFHHDQVSFTGTTHVEAELDLADALDLDAALTRGAAHLKACGSTESLDVRRALAAGDIARLQLTLDLTETMTASAAEGTRGRARQVVLYVHLSEAALVGASDHTQLARVENTRNGVTADQVRSWCANPETQVVVRPVIDLAEHVHVDAYEVPDRLAEQTRLRDHTCVFPWCNRPARGCDNDHCTPHQHGGPTCSCNIASLCRRHHRLKTHTAWTYTVLDPGTFLWRSPHGYQFLRDHQGTHDVSLGLPPGGVCHH